MWACLLLGLAVYKYRIEQNMASTRYFEQGKNSTVVFDENAFDEITFRRTGNSTKTFDEVSRTANNNDSDSIIFKPVLLLYLSIYKTILSGIF